MYAIFGTKNLMTFVGMLCSSFY